MAESRLGKREQELRNRYQKVMRQEADMEGHDAQEKEAQWNKKNMQGVRVGQDREEQGQLLACRLAIMIAD